MPKQSAGLLLFRRRAGALEVLLVHPGGPFWAKRDLGAWSIPKGELDAGGIRSPRRGASSRRRRVCAPRDRSLRWARSASGAESR
jgi:predicted NUDIX family NTP pyrophosphohydrolase